MALVGIILIIDVLGSIVLAARAVTAPSAAAMAATAVATTVKAPAGELSDATLAQVAFAAAQRGISNDELVGEALRALDGGSPASAAAGTPVPPPPPR